MRVTKTVKDYIEKCVREKVYKKYEAEEAEAKRQNDILSNFEEELEELIRKTAKEKIDTFVEENDFIEVSDSSWSVNGGYKLSIKNIMYENSVCQWKFM